MAQRWCESISRTANRRMIRVAAVFFRALLGGAVWFAWRPKSFLQSFAPKRLARRTPAALEESRQLAIMGVLIAVCALVILATQDAE